MGCLRRARALPFVRRFRMKDVEAATNGFTTTATTTSGGGAAAYRARFAGGLVATVRRASSGEGKRKGKEDFYLEVQLLARLNHRHVVRLRGFSEGHRDRFLLFDQVETNRTLKDCLHDPLRTPLDWRTRLQVATDIAAALEYLYYLCDPPVFHASVDSGSVMVDAGFVAKLSDVTVVIGHDDIERRRRDLVFRYGVLVLELVTGQSPGDGELVRWVQDPGAGSVHRMVDADLGGAYDAVELRDLLVVARLCTRRRGGNDDDDAVSVPRIVRYLQGKVGRRRLGGGCWTVCGS